MPKKRILPYVLLGLINSHQQMSGYQMMQEFKHEISDFWTASHSQIYPELQRMLKDGWIQAVDTTSVAAKGKAVFYHLTATGKAALLAWLSEPLTPQNDDLFPLKLFFIADQDSPILTKLLKQQYQLSLQRRDYLKARMALLFKQQADIDQNYGHYLILDRGIQRETNYVKWLAALLKE
ncbi:MAG: PadR family transcriptional regulator [Lactobacillus sp.]|jgi:DNA-binding PadR family transcriptional regulator|nr:PadR family transcriptional regulator [Lactobacillus sp.]